MQTNSVICHMVAKECQELQRGGCEPSLEKLSACVYRLGGRGAVEASVSTLAGTTTNRGFVNSRFRTVRHVTSHNIYYVKSMIVV